VNSMVMQGVALGEKLEGREEIADGLIQPDGN
jgi:hypothetical protein